MERVQQKHVVDTINLILVHSYHDQQIDEVIFKKTVEEPVINDKDWHSTLETIKEYLVSQYGGTGATFDYAVRPDIAVKTEDEDPAEGYATMNQPRGSPSQDEPLWMTCIRYGTPCPTCVASTHALFTSRLLYATGM
jgi:nitrogen regulatory protein PII